MLVVTAPFIKVFYPPVAIRHLLAAADTRAHQPQQRADEDTHDGAVGENCGKSNWDTSATMEYPTPPIITTVPSPIKKLPILSAFLRFICHLHDCHVPTGITLQLVNPL